MTGKYKSTADLLFEKAAETDDTWLAQMATEVKATEEVSSHMTMFLLDIQSTVAQYLKKAEQVLTDSLSAERQEEVKAEARRVIAERRNASVEDEIARVLKDLSSPKA